ncbi:hypothetical protein SCLCIDRAFT_1224851 [Scleroderma citrinum Foug A]|uniref:ER membrane protein complex subunit 7 beta-sandwich domain-containing protein n=1 Tax=Scleroderma citrinum Foug A TaxID=1036808 RepID=A0A0C3D3Y7_9AGAM|nr:hypothetical protein SCLCIDRAFT_1224851 [Scleroderma citrinum Foug A]
MRLVSLLSVLAGLKTALAIDLVGHVQWNDLCPNYKTLGATKVILDAGRYSARVTWNGNFSIPDVDPGTYVMSVLSHDHTFDKLRIDISSTSALPEIKSHVFGTPLLSPSAVFLSYPITLTPRGKNSYFKPHESFSVLGMFQNPMMVLMLLTGLMLLGLPYVMKNTDPQTLEEIKGQHAKFANIQNSIQSGNIKSGISALLTGDEETKSAGASSGARAQSNNGSTVQQRKAGKGGKRR